LKCPIGYFYLTMVHFYHKVDYWTEKEYRVKGPGFDRQVDRKPRPVGGELH
jgi:hypothetical protein